MSQCSRGQGCIFQTQRKDWSKMNFLLLDSCIQQQIQYHAFQEILGTNRPTDHEQTTDGQTGSQVSFTSKKQLVLRNGFAFDIYSFLW